MQTRYWSSRNKDDKVCMKNRKYILGLQFIFVLLLFGMDQWTKKNIHVLNQIFSYWISFQEVKNTGVVLGFLGQESDFLNIVGVNTLGAVLILIYALFFYYNRTNRIWIHFGVAFVFAGIFGNWFDRFTNHYVIDFLVITITANTKLVINLADIYIWLGFVMIVSQGKYFENIFSKLSFAGQKTITYMQLKNKFYNVFGVLVLKTGFIIFVFSYSFLKVVLSLNQFNLKPEIENQILDIYWWSFLSLITFIAVLYWLAAQLVVQRIIVSNQNVQE